ncbi:hypothetical protein AB0N09_05925 [Streptomyces erythrochromogenes]|uniref:GP88 family protein n=1 Tax=Streptomyces erythrochromogenes TaxID=285574 RepID=UPI003418266A
MATDWLLTQNTRMKVQGIWNWTLPAWAVSLKDTGPDGAVTTRNINVCPQAGVCAKFCYALDGAYRYPNVRQRHENNLRLVLDTPLLWQERMATELRHRRYAGANIRIHDAGDFFDDAYTMLWLELVRGAPQNQTFYAYTKEVSRFRRLVLPNTPANFKFVFSLGGKEDHLIDKDLDRHADVFPDTASLEAAGYSSQAASDLLAVFGPPRVGMASNRPRKGLKHHSFGELQELDNTASAERRARARDKARTGR